MIPSICCSDAVSLMSSALAWEFSRTEAGRFSAGRFGFAHAVNRQDTQTISPGPRWRDTLLVPPADDWLVQLLATLGRAQGEQALLAARCRTLLVQLCSLTGAHLMAVLCQHGNQSLLPADFLPTFVPVDGRNSEFSRRLAKIYLAWSRAFSKWG